MRESWSCNGISDRCSRRSSARPARRLSNSRSCSGACTKSRSRRRVISGSTSLRASCAGCAPRPIATPTALALRCSRAPRRLRPPRPSRSPGIWVADTRRGGDTRPNVLRPAAGRAAEDRGCDRAQARGGRHDDGGAVARTGAGRPGDTAKGRRRRYCGGSKSDRARRADTSARGADGAALTLRSCQRKDARARDPCGARPGAAERLSRHLGARRGLGAAGTAAGAGRRTRRASALALAREPGRMAGGVSKWLSWTGGASTRCSSDLLPYARGATRRSGLPPGA